MRVEFSATNGTTQIVVYRVAAGELVPRFNGGGAVRPENESLLWRRMPEGWQAWKDGETASDDFLDEIGLEGGPDVRKMVRRLRGAEYIWDLAADAEDVQMKERLDRAVNSGRWVVLYNALD